MPLKTFSLNKALFSNLSRSIIFLTIVNIICTFILVPFSYIIAHVNRGDVDHTHSKYLVGEMMTSPLYFVGSMMYALLCSAFLTYFFKSQAASDFIHSLPIKRERILITSYAVFFTHLLVNLLINGIITWVVGIKYASIDIEKIIIWILVNLLIDCFVFTITMLFGLYINNMLNHIISSVILIFSPFILGTLIFTTHMFMFKGLQTYPDNIMKEFTVPVRFVEDVVKDNLDAKYLLIVFIVSLILFALLFVVYSRRKNERINEAYSTNYANFIVFVVSMLIATLLGGIIYNSIFLEHSYITIFIYLVSFTLVYIFLEMLSQKSVRINLNRKLYAITLGIVAAALVGVYVMGQVREHYLPKVEDVKSVSTTFTENDDSLQDGIVNNTKITDKKFIQDVIEGQQQLMAAEKVDDFSDNQMIIDINYKLNDGKSVKREYYIEKKTYDKYMEQVATKENAATLARFIVWDKLMRNDVTLDIETADNSYSGELLNKKQKAQLKQLLIDKFKNNYNQKEQTSKDNSALHFTFSYKNEELGEDTMNVSIYDKEIIHFLVDEKIITDISSAIPYGNVYDLGDKSNYDKIKDEDDITQLDFAKKIKRSTFKENFKKEGPNPKGNHLYFFESNNSFVKMTK